MQIKTENCAFCYVIKLAYFRPKSKETHFGFEISKVDLVEIREKN